MIAKLPASFVKISLQTHFDLRMRKHALEHRGVTPNGQRLEALGQISIVAIRPNRHASAHARVEIAWFAPPLLARVVFKKTFVQRPSNLGDDYLLGIPRLSDWHPPLLEHLLHFPRVAWAFDELLKRVEIYRESLIRRE